MSIVLSCPSCGTRYRADPQAIGLAGRRVRCTACSHVWLAESEEPVSLTSVDPEPVPEPEPEPEVPAEPPKPHQAYRAKVEAKRKTASMAVAGGAWAALAACWMLVLSGAWAFRVDIVQSWPRASAAYAALGVEIDPSGFQLSELSITREVDHGVPVVIIEGEILNQNRQTRPVPQVRAALLDSQDTAVLSWRVNIEAHEMSGGSRLAFRTLVSDPPPAAIQAEVILAGLDLAPADPVSDVSHGAEDHHSADTVSHPAGSDQGGPEEATHESPEHGTALEETATHENDGHH
ncbi:DUF3426 domain-containing protein [Maricaulis sp. D1M11]|uniref:DUF3426 domain-containing protein n=1 Tax=Maricaulis sp. D1M11 TaxID=3076117 RepID=UPI0039B53650